MTGMIYFSKLCSLILLILFSFAGYCPNWVHTALDSINNINSTSNSDSGEIAIAEKKIEARRITPWHFYAHLSFACTLLFIANWPFSWLEIDSPDTRFICSRKWKAENVRLTEWASGWREPGKTPAANGSQRNERLSRNRDRKRQIGIASAIRTRLVHFCPLSSSFCLSFCWHVHCTHCFLFLGIDY